MRRASTGSRRWLRGSPVRAPTAAAAAALGNALATFCRRTGVCVCGRLRCGSARVARRETALVALRALCVRWRTGWPLSASRPRVLATLPGLWLARLRRSLRLLRTLGASSLRVAGGLRDLGRHLALSFTEHGLRRLQGLERRGVGPTRPTPRVLHGSGACDRPSVTASLGRHSPTPRPARASWAARAWPRSTARRLRLLRCGLPMAHHHLHAAPRRSRTR